VTVGETDDPKIKVGVKRKENIWSICGLVEDSAFGRLNERIKIGRVRNVIKKKKKRIH